MLRERCAALHQERRLMDLVVAICLDERCYHIATVDVRLHWLMALVLGVVIHFIYSLYN